ncbi:hypothetical protein B0T17DRAFT_313821 [Bombardia bombarda]|uniref:Uncharacterized protein n=1 Tax=Bombardia bombarda TaxID=252184 RepID=A0AA40BXY1_9PEZI|nr:hypothetical protein B0T17DRAFT_313821 [Bombardia bombarda]
MSAQPSRRHRAGSVRGSRAAGTSSRTGTGPSNTPDPTANYEQNTKSVQQNRDTEVRWQPYPGRPRTRSISRRLLEEEARSSAPEVAESNGRASSQIQNGDVQENEEAKPWPSGNWRPDITINAPLFLPGENLSRIELADRKIAHRRFLVEIYPGLASHLERLENAIREREQLDENDVENTAPE